jgi:hypothetical protein
MLDDCEVIEAARLDEDTARRLSSTNNGSLELRLLDVNPKNRPDLLRLFAERQEVVDMKASTRDHP